MSTSNNQQAGAELGQAQQNALKLTRTELIKLQPTKWSWAVIKGGTPNIRNGMVFIHEIIFEE